MLRPVLSTLALVAATLPLMGATCSAPPQPKPQSLANVQTAPIKPLQELSEMAPPAASDGSTGLTTATVVRSADELGSFAASVPTDFDFGSESLVYLGSSKALRRASERATELVLVEADARDAYTPGVSVTDSATASMVSVTFDRHPCCGVAAESRASCENDFVATSTTWQEERLTLYAVPRANTPLQVMVQQTPCED